MIKHRRISRSKDSAVTGSAVMTSQITWSLLAGGKVHNHRAAPLLDLVISCVFVFGRRMSGQDMAYSAYNQYRGRPCRPLHTSLSVNNNLNCRRNYVCQSVVWLCSDQQIQDPPRPLSLPACCCCTNHYRLLLLTQSCMACQGQGH